jgi:hypothetical protein
MARSCSVVGMIERTIDYRNLDLLLLFNLMVFFTASDYGE